MSSNDDGAMRDFIDALRGALGLAPLYKQLPPRALFADVHTYSSLRMRPTNATVAASFHDGREYVEANGRRVGRVFVQKPIQRRPK